MSARKIVLGFGVVAAAALCVMFAMPADTVRGQEKSSSLQKDLTGKKIELYFTDQEAKQIGFDCIFSLDATVTSVNDIGLILQTTKKWIRNTYYSDGPRVEDAVEKDFAFTIFVPWSAVKYIKIAKPA